MKKNLENLLRSLTKEEVYDYDPHNDKSYLEWCKKIYVSKNYSKYDLILDIKSLIEMSKDND